MKLTSDSIKTWPSRRLSAFKAMQLSLARWEDDHGDSAGYWIIRQLPGFVIERGAQGWKIFCGDDYIRHQWVDASRVWGEDWEPAYGLFAATPQKVLGPHPTRAAALASLEAHLSKLSPSPSALEEVL